MAFSICYWANHTQGKTKLSRKSENAVADDRVLKFLYDADLRHVESILSEMSSEIQEWSYKSRSRINNLYLFTRPIDRICTHRGDTTVAKILLLLLLCISFTLMLVIYACHR